MSYAQLPNNTADSQPNLIVVGALTGAFTMGIAAPMRTEKTTPDAYRLAKKPDGTLVLQGSYMWYEGWNDFVYFKTTPMQGATPGAVLSFAGLRKLNFKADIKPVKVPVNDAAKIDRIKTLLAKIGGQWEEGHKTPTMTHPPIRDALFAQVAEEEGLAGVEGNWRSTLTFHGENG